MTQEEKLSKLLNWYSDKNPEKTKILKKQGNLQRLYELEEMVGDHFPEDIRNLFEKFDGESGDGYGSFFGHSLINLAEMKNSLDFARTQIKPDNPKVSNPEKSSVLIEKIIQSIISELPLKKKMGFIKPKWCKVEFQIGPSSMGGPYFYPNESTSDKERDVLRLSSEARKQISILTKELHEIEVNDYNWDNLDIIAYGDGRHTVDRNFFDFDNALTLTSTPEGAIKKKYFHIKWIPLISDFAGNYIGIDLDPDLNGTHGQVIIFGRDEEHMIVLANSWDDFLDWNLSLIGQQGNQLKSESHLHDVYKQIKNA